MHPKGYLLFTKKTGRRDAICFGHFCFIVISTKVYMLSDFQKELFLIWFLFIFLTIASQHPPVGGVILLGKDMVRTSKWDHLRS